MVKSNEIALKLKNNFTEDISIALFPNANSNNFDWNQTKAQFYNLSTVPFYGFEEGIYLFYRLKNSNSAFSSITIPYTVADNGGEFSVDLEFFCPFFQNWFPSTNLGVCVSNNPDIIIWSSDYEFGGIEFITNIDP